MSVLLAALIFTLTPATQFGAKSNAVNFTGTFSNPNLTGDIFLNDIQITVTNLLTGQTNTFFANVPGILAPGETYSGIVFTVAISSNTPVGNYFGSVTIQGGTNIVAANNLASQPFQVSSSDTLFNAWRTKQFGISTNNPAISGDLADPDGDGVANLLEYALDGDPNVADAGSLPVPAGDAACGCLSLIYTKTIAATDLIYTPEAADAPDGSWSTNGISQSIIDADTETLTIRASDMNHPLATAGKRFFHLKIAR